MIIYPAFILLTFILSGGLVAFDTTTSKRPTALQKELVNLIPYGWYQDAFPLENHGDSELSAHFIAAVSGAPRNAKAKALGKLNAQQTCATRTDIDIDVIEPKTARAAKSKALRRLDNIVDAEDSGDEVESENDDEDLDDFEDSEDCDDVDNDDLEGTDGNETTSLSTRKQTSGTKKSTVHSALQKELDSLSFYGSYFKRHPDECPSDFGISAHFSGTQPFTQRIAKARALGQITNQGCLPALENVEGFEEVTETTTTSTSETRTFKRLKKKKPVAKSSSPQKDISKAPHYRHAPRPQFTNTDIARREERYARLPLKRIFLERWLEEVANGTHPASSNE